MSAGGEVRYQFVASGHDSVIAAFKSIRQAAEEAYRATGRAAGQAARAQERGAAAGAAAGRASAGERARGEARWGTAAERAAMKAVLAERRAANERLQIVKFSVREIERELDREARAAERAAARKVAAERRASEAAFKKSKDIAAAGLGGLASKAFGGIVTGATLALGTVGAAARETVTLDDAARRLSISARGAGEKGVDPTVLRREFENTAVMAPGVSATDVAAGTQAFVAKTGNLDVARSMQRTFAVTAAATGSEYGDIAGSAADIMQKFDIKGVEAMQQAFATLTFQGKKGAFELKDAAAYFSEMASAAQRFGVGTGPKALATLGGLSQIARTATGSAAEAATAVQDMFAELTLKSSKIKAKHGVDVYDKAGRARDIKDVLTDLIGKAGGANIEEKKSALQHIFGARGIRAISPLIDTFTKTSLDTKGSDEKKVAEGMKAVRAALEDSINAPGTWADVLEDYAESTKSTGSQLTAAWEQLKAKTDQEVTPALIQLIPQLLKLTDAMGPAIHAFATLVEALAGVVAFLQDKGLLRERKQTKAEAAQKLKDFDDAMRAKGVGKGGAENPDTAKTMTEADRRQRSKLVNAVRDADEREHPRFRMTMSRDQFVEEMVRRRGKDGWLGDAQTERERARETYDNLMRDPNGERGKHESWLTRPFADTDEQVAMIRQMAEMAQFQKTQKQWDQGHPGEKPTLSTEAMNNELAASAERLREFNQALRRYDGKGSILSQ